MILSQSYRFLSIKITIYFFFCLLLLPNTFASHPQFLCRRDQREALLEVQKEFHVPTTTWNKSIDCCSWDGVQCDDILGEVISLYLDSLNTSSISLKTSSGIFKLQNLRELGLSKCNLQGEIPSSLGNLSHLTYLDISYCNLQGEIPSSIGNLSHLKSLRLSYCNLQGKIPSSIGNLSHLTQLDLSNNQLVGEIPPSVGNLNQLESIYLRGNELRGNIPTFVSKLVNLGSLFISHNNFGGRIPSSISKLGNLLYLDLSHNNLGGRVPRSISTLVNLTFIDLSYNKLEGQVPHCIWRPPLQRARTGYVDLSHNSLSSFGKSVELGDGSLVTWLDLSSNSLQGPIPHWFCNLRELFLLDLSNNHLNGSIPQCLTIMNKLNLRNNSLSGFMPDVCINGLGLRSLDVSHNNLVGKLPKSLSSCGLEFLNVRGNNFKDTFPFWLGSSSLVVLVLRSNAFYGPIYNISTNLLGFPSLRIIDISNNNFVGSLPQDYFANWTDMSSVWSSYGSSPEYMADAHGEYEDSIDLVNKGVDTYFIQIFLGLKAIDFSGNRFSGHIPGSIGLLSGLYLLNLSGNAFTGHIPTSLANITKLEILDLSRNNLSGEIPQGLGNLSSLSNINFSHNHLQGLVPQSTQFGSQNCSSFLDNNGLYGLEDICGKHHVPVPTAQQQPEESLLEPEEPVLNWIAAAIAFGPGVFCGLVIGHIFTSYKHLWFVSR